AREVEAQSNVTWVLCDLALEILGHAVNGHVLELGADEHCAHPQSSRNRRRGEQNDRQTANAFAVRSHEAPALTLHALHVLQGEGSCGAIYRPPSCSTSRRTRRR